MPDLPEPVQKPSIAENARNAQRFIVPFGVATLRFDLGGADVTISVNLENNDQRRRLELFLNEIAESA